MKDEREAGGDVRVVTDWRSEEAEGRGMLKGGEREGTEEEEGEGREGVMIGRRDGGSWGKKI